MFIKQIAIDGYDKNFSYFIGDEDTKGIAIVDPGDVPRLEKEIEQGGWQVVKILLTHSHHDHIEGVPALVEKYKVPVFMHRNAGDRVSFNGEFLEDGDVVEVGNGKVQVLHTPGHIDDAVCYLVDGNKLVTGDTVFVEGCGRADLPGSNVNDLYVSLERIKALGDDIEVYPGHNYGSKPVSTIGYEKENNKYFLCEDFEAFKRLRMGR